MAATYHNVTLEEIRNFLEPQGFEVVDTKKYNPADRTQEIVFGKRVDQDDLALTLRIFTGINPTGNSRDVGKDAIRVALFYLRPDFKIVEIGGSKRVNRVGSWKKNLQSRLDEWHNFLPKEKCKKCGMPLYPKTGKHGTFLACAGYPECKKN